MSHGQKNSGNCPLAHRTARLRSDSISCLSKLRYFLQAATNRRSSRAMFSSSVRSLSASSNFVRVAATRSSVQPPIRSKHRWTNRCSRSLPFLPMTSSQRSCPSARESSSRAESDKGTSSSTHLIASRLLRNDAIHVFAVASLPRFK